jgi:5-methyltetrahydropteroyltriglutamate--homocysteine methyltransferase
VEHPELVAWRIQNLARLVGRENVIAGSDCGFCQGWHEIRVHPSIQWAKLRSLCRRRPPGQQAALGLTGGRGDVA